MESGTLSRGAGKERCLIPRFKSISHKRLGRFKKREGKRRRGTALTDVLEDVDDEERRDQVVDALHVAAGWVADGPDEQDPLKDLTHTKTRCQNKGNSYREHQAMQTCSQFTLT